MRAIPAQPATRLPARRNGTTTSSYKPGAPAQTENLIRQQLRAPSGGS
jgi:hypothetical protein